MQGFFGCRKQFLILVYTVACVIVCHCMVLGEIFQDTLLNIMAGFEIFIIQDDSRSECIFRRAMINYAYLAL